MKLPGPNSGIQWMDYRNATPTFEITPIEKPDFSPFLIHMTGKNSLLSILKGENRPQGRTINQFQGFLKAVIPSYDGGRSYYNSPVVCFTEAPIFALDFFRYRSFSRWEADQQFGIGFSKTDLIVNANVRPVIYLDTETNSQILNLINNIISGTLFVVNNQCEVVDYKETFKKIKPLVFPLLEQTRMQGFMWEREWRCPFESGLFFPYSAIKVICCPEEEKAEIEQLLGPHLKSIQIVQSWKEYDDVTNYLKRREKETNQDALKKIAKINSIPELKQLKIQNEQTKNMLLTHYNVFKETTNGLEKGNISDVIENMKSKSAEIQKRIEELAKVEAKKELERKLKEGQANIKAN